MVHIPHDANDRSFEAGDGDLRTERRLSRPVAFRHSLVDEQCSRRFVRVQRREVASLEAAHAHGGDV